MDHRYIDDFSVAGRYLDRTLTPDEHRSFELHVVGCPECADRVLLAQMWRERKPNFLDPVQPLSLPAAHKDQPPALPAIARMLARYRPWQLVTLFTLAALALISVPAVYFLSELARLSRR